jgi:hypothetical protein
MGKEPYRGAVTGEARSPADESRKERKGCNAADPSGGSVVGKNGAVAIRGDELDGDSLGSSLNTPLYLTEGKAVKPVPLNPDESSRSFRRVQTV